MAPPVRGAARLGLRGQVVLRRRTAAGAVILHAPSPASDFIGPAPTFTALSPTPELLAATWALFRESSLAGQAPRLAKEVVAAAVSRTNRCQFCIDAHGMFIHALGEHSLAETIAHGQTPDDPHLADLLDWAVASRTPRREKRPGPAGHVAEYLGTLLAFHFIKPRRVRTARREAAAGQPATLPAGPQPRRPRERTRTHIGMTARTAA